MTVKIEEHKSNPNSLQNPSAQSQSYWYIGEWGSRSGFDLNDSICQAYDMGHFAYSHRKLLL